MSPVKVNAVVQRGLNDHTVLDLLERFRGTRRHRAHDRVHGRRQPQRLATRAASCRREELLAARPGALARLGARRATIAAKSPSATATTTARARSASFPRSARRSAAPAAARGCRPTACSTRACSRRKAPTCAPAARGRERRRARRERARRLDRARRPLQRAARRAARSGQAAAQGRNELHRRLMAAAHAHVRRALTQPTMVDVGGKARDACARPIAEARVRFRPRSPRRCAKPGFATKKGPVFDTAIIAGVMAAKRTHELIPFCHPLGLEDCDDRDHDERARRGRRCTARRPYTIDRRRDGSADRREHRGADDLRHVQGAVARDRDRRDAPAGEARRPARRRRDERPARSHPRAARCARRSTGWCSRAARSRRMRTRQGRARVPRPAAARTRVRAAGPLLRADVHLGRAASRATIRCARHSRRSSTRRTISGPIAGIAAAQATQPGHRPGWCSPATCRSSTPAALERLLERAQHATAGDGLSAAAHDGLPEPLCAIYEPASARPSLRQHRAGRNCPRKFLITWRYALLEPGSREALDNVNTPDEYAAAHGRADRPSTTAIHEPHPRAVLRRAARTGRHAATRRSMTAAANTGRALRELRARHRFTLAPDDAARGGQRRILRLGATARGRRPRRLHPAGGGGLMRHIRVQRRSRSSPSACARARRCLPAGGYASFEGWVRDHNEGRRCASRVRGVRGARRSRGRAHRRRGGRTLRRLARGLRASRRRPRDRRPRGLGRRERARTAPRRSPPAATSSTRSSTACRSGRRSTTSTATRAGSTAKRCAEPATSRRTSAARPGS